MNLLGEIEKWKEAACRHPVIDPETFFDPKTVSEAKSICQECPIRMLCLEFALTEKIYDGVWGGLSEDERRSFNQKRSLTLARKGLK